MLKFAREVRTFVEEAGRKDYFDDLATRRSIERSLELVGEAASKVSDAFKEAHPEIPWRDIVDQRHRLIHGYRDIDVSRLQNVIERRLPALIEQLEKLVPPIPPDPEPER